MPARNDPRQEERQAIARLSVPELLQLRERTVSRIEDVDDALRRLGAELPKERMSVLAFARRVGVDEAAVRKGIKNGRLQLSVGRDDRGRLVILDAALAEREWRDNKDHSKDRNVESPVVQDRRALVREQERKLKLANDEKEGRLIDARVAQEQEAARITAAKNQLLGIPTKAKQRIPSLTTEGITELSAMIREVLEDLAAGRTG